MSALPMPPTPAPGAKTPHHGHRRGLGPHTHHQHHRASALSSSSISSLSSDDDEDAITPCPPGPQNNHLHDHFLPHSPPPDHNQQQQLQQQPPPPSSRPQRRPAAPAHTSWRSSLVMHHHDHDAHDKQLEHGTEEDVDAETLWRRMLAIQRAFGCYNSARMRAAVDMGDSVGDGFIPSRTCLDLLNDSIDQLPEESRRRVEEFLEHGDAKGSRRRSWRERLHMPGPAFD